MASFNPFMHLDETSPYGSYIKNLAGFVDDGQTIIALPENAGSILPATLSTVSLPPQNSAISLNLNDPAQLDFTISSREFDIDVIKSIYIDFTITNTSPDTEMLIAPTPYIFQNQQVLVKLPNSCYQEDENSHLSMLYTLNQEKCHYILERENFIDLPGQNSVTWLTNAPGDATIYNYPSLSVNLGIPAGTSRKLRLYMIGGPMLSKGFSPALLRNQQNITLRYFFKQSTAWCSLPSNIQISTPRLQITGLKVNKIFKEAFAASVSGSNAMVIPYQSYIPQVRPTQTFSAGNEVEYVLTNTKCQANYIFSFIRPASPSGTSLTTLSRYVQNSSPRTLRVAIGAVVAATVPGSYGEQFTLDRWSLRPQGGLSTIISQNTSSSEISEMFQVANDYQSYLASEYKSLYLIPLGSKIDSDISRATYSNGVTEVNNTFSIYFTPQNNIVDAQYITVVSAASCLVITKDSVYEKLI